MFREPQRRSLEAACRHEVVHVHQRYPWLLLVDADGTKTGRRVHNLEVTEIRENHTKNSHVDGKSRRNHGVPW